MTCPNCGSENVSISFEEMGSKTKKTGVGLGGHMNNMARGVMAMSTLGMSNLVWKKSKGEAKTKNIKKKVCLCQSCGNSWYL